MRRVRRVERRDRSARIGRVHTEDRPDVTRLDGARRSVARPPAAHHRGPPTPGSACRARDRHRRADPGERPGRLDRSGPPRRRHRPRAGRGRRAEGRQRPPRHRDEPRPAGLHAVPAGHAARPHRRRLDRPRPVRALRRALQPHALHPAVPLRLRPGARRPRGAAHLGLARPPATPSTGTPPASRSPPARWARAWPRRSAWRWPPAASAACSTRTPRPARARSTTRST